jgi:hypothetical protein
MRKISAYKHSEGYAQARESRGRGKVNPAESMPTLAGI